MAENYQKPRLTRRQSPSESTTDVTRHIAPRTKESRQLTGVHGSPVPISDDVEAEKIQGTMGRRLEERANHAHDHISRLSVGGDNTLARRPSTKRPTLEKE